jgi:endonuclease/exonuclease/phosphatase family metal-dependent hydrolase
LLRGISWAHINDDMTASYDQEIEVGNFALRGPVPGPHASIRVVDWNINRGLQLSGVIEFLSSTKADLILLQEVDLNARRTRHLNIAREISQKLEMNYVFGREFQELSQGPRTSPAYHGQATLSPWPLSQSRLLRFRRQSSFWRPRWFLPEIPLFQERVGGRMALVSNVTVAGRTLVAYNLHLESRGNDNLRCSQFEECFKDADHYTSGTPIIMAGDLNLDASRSVPADLIRRANFHRAVTDQHVPTTPPRSPFDRGQVVDWVVTRGSIKTVSLEVNSSVSASDHYPLSLKVAFT